MIEFISGVITITISLIMALIMGHIFVLVFELDGHIKRLQKKIANVAEWKTKSDIDKQIAKEKKKIQAEEKEIESMHELEKLIAKRKKMERRREELFEEVHSGTNADCQWCGEDDCLKPAYTVDGIAQYYCTSCHRWLNDGSSKV